LLIKAWPVFAQRLVSHEQSEVTTGGHVVADQLRRCGGVLGKREDLVGRGDLVGRAVEEVERRGELDVLAAKLEITADQRVVTKQSVHGRPPR